MESITELLHWIKELLNPKNIIDFLTTKGLLLTYFGLIFIVFAETGLAVGFFLPGDSLLVVPGLGDAVGYYTGHKLGARLFTRKKSLMSRPSLLQKAHEFYEKYGGK